MVNRPSNANATVRMQCNLYSSLTVNSLSKCRGNNNGEMAIMMINNNDNINAQRIIKNQVVSLAIFSMFNINFIQLTNWIKEYLSFKYLIPVRRNDWPMLISIDNI